MWPNGLEVYGRLEREPSARREGDNHIWYYSGKIWQCAACLRTTRDPKSVNERCLQMPPKFLQATCEPKGHHIWMANLRNVEPPHGLFISCTRCAHYGTSRSTKLLAAPCKGGPEGVAGARDKKLFANGMHPKRGPFNRPWPLVIHSHGVARENMVSPESVVVSDVAAPERVSPFDCEWVDCMPAVGEAAEAD